MARLLAFLIFLLVGGTGAFLILNFREDYRLIPADVQRPMDVDPFSYWQTYIPEDEAFSVLLPTLPSYTSDSITNPKTKEVKLYDIYVAEKNSGAMFVITKITFLGGQIPSEQEILELFQKEMVQSDPENRLLELEKEHYHGRNAVTLAIENLKGRMDGLIFVNGRTVYLLAVMSEPGAVVTADIDTFRSSFRLLGETADEQ